MTITLKKILIANRGEIAVRIAKTCQKLGITPVAVYAWPDKHALHKKLISESYLIDEELPVKAYLSIDKIIEIAKKSNCDAIHPGYGFLSENANFANACKDNNIIFIGPSAESMAAVGDKISAKKLAEKLSVPTANWLLLDEKQTNQLQIINDFAKSCGYPFLIKASAGGGGRGMRVVRCQGEIENALIQASREALSSFGNPQIFCEKLIEDARHIEVQFIGDANKNIFTLYDRDCSAQRNHQKVIEEAPALNLSDDLRLSLYEYTKKLANEINYQNAGTAEFLVTKDGKPYFLEINSRLQVEHPVSESITGLDFVELQIKSAQSEDLSKYINLPKLPDFKKHAIEFRVCAELPQKNYLPMTGIIKKYHATETNGIRIDSGLSDLSEVSPYFDSMLLKLISFSENRSGAIQNLKNAVSSYLFVGVENNLALLTYLLNEPDFLNAFYTTNLIKNSAFLSDYEKIAEQAGALACCAEIILNDHSTVAKRGFRINSNNILSKTLFHQSKTFNYNYQIINNEVIKINDQIFKLKKIAEYAVNFDTVQKVEQKSVKDSSFSVSLFKDTNSLWVACPFGHFKYDLIDPLASKKVSNSQLHNEIKCDLPGKILQVNVKISDIIDTGTPIVVMESMKMEHTISAPAKAEVKAIKVKTGDQVENNTVLVELNYIK
jgi:3-methylcrotonyl-CoA carboxylase alpha subunit